MAIKEIPGFLRRRRKGGAWHYCLYLNGKLWERSTGTRDRRRAEAKAEELHARASLLKKNKDGVPLLSQAIVQEVARIEDQESPLKAERVSQALCNFLQANGDAPLDKIDTEALEAYQRKRLRARKCRSKTTPKDSEDSKAPRPTISASTVNKELVYITRLLKGNGFHVEKPKPLPGRATPGRPFTEAELAAFFDACATFPDGEPGKYMAHFLTLLATGARPAELFPSSRSTHVALLKKEIDPNTGTVTIRSAKQQPGQRGISTRVKVAKPLLEMVDSVAEAAPGPHVFSALPDLAHIFDKICMRAGIRKIDSLGQKLTAHSFRHTFGTMLAEQGASGFIIQNVMRHKDPKQTARYLERAATTAVIDISPFMIQRVKTGQ